MTITLFMCRMFGHRWEAKSYKKDGFASYWRCRRCKAFHYFADERKHKP